jgi:exodeoxyribonuclease-3
MTSILSYNVNGIRAAYDKQLYTWLHGVSPDILCLQETKAQPAQLAPELLNPEGYHTYWHSAEQKGYSGVAIFSKQEPLQVEYGCGESWIDAEGRVLRADFPDFSVMSLYLPSGTSGDHRQGAKDQFLEFFLPYVRDLLQRVPRLVISGDYNIAHHPIDIHDPAGNKNSSGFLPHERAWMTDFLSIGLTDSFRHFNPEPGNYSWWSYRSGARARNKGWRIDYHLVSTELMPRCTGASILPDAVHSDHCPIAVQID